MKELMSDAFAQRLLLVISAVLIALLAYLLRADVEIRSVMLGFAGIVFGWAAIRRPGDAAGSPPKDPPDNQGGTATRLRTTESYLDAPWDKPPGAAIVARRLGLVTLVFVACVYMPGLMGCAVFQSAKPVLRTVDDVATNLCALFFADRQSISVEDAARTFCRTKRQLQPWIDEVLAAQQAAGLQAVSSE
jgi:hypothetical protein